MTLWLAVAVWGVVVVAQGWVLRLWLAQISAQLATLTYTVHDLNDRIAALDDELHAVDQAVQAKEDPPRGRPGGS